MPVLSIDTSINLVHKLPIVGRSRVRIDSINRKFADATRGIAAKRNSGRFGTLALVASINACVFAGVRWVVPRRRKRLTTSIDIHDWVPCPRRVAAWACECFIDMPALLRDAGMAHIGSMPNLRYPTKIPPVNASSNGNSLRSGSRLRPSNTFRCGPPPSPAAVMMSSASSSFALDTVTRTPPVKPGV